MAKSENKIIFNNISKVYDSPTGKVEAIDNVSLNIKEGEFISIIGPSGCGKSTLLFMAAGLIRPTSGEITISGRTVNKPVRDVGFVFQDHLLLDWRNIKNNILLPLEMNNEKKFDDKKADELIELVGLKGFENNYPFELSGGMKQRVALCRALVSNPSTLLMDEPFGALDALTREQIRYELEKLWLVNEPTTLLVTHDMEEAIILGDKVVIMSKRPSTILDIIEIDLPRPRVFNEDVDQKVDQYKAKIRHLFEKIGVIGSGANAS